MANAQILQTMIMINAKTGNGFSKVGATLTELGAMVDGLSQNLVNFGKESVDVYRNYEKSMKDAEVALSTTYGRNTKELSGVMSQLDEAATQWAATTIFHTNDVANAISEAAHAGWDYNQIMSGIPAAIQLAQAGSLDLSEAVNYIVKSTNAAGIEFEDMADFIDLWAFAANSSASTIGEFGDAMLRMGSTMRFTGNTEELMTLIAVTANAGSVGEEAGTMIRNSMIRLIAPTDKANEAMEILGATSEETAGLLEDEALAAANAELAAHGFSAYGTNGELKNILDVYRELYLALGEIAGGYENIDRNQDSLQILSAIFPTRTITEALTLLRGAAEGYDGLYDAMRQGEAEGYGAYAAEMMMNTLDGSIETFLSKAERLKQLVGEELSEPLQRVLEIAGGMVDTISELDEEKFDILVSGAGALAAAGPGLIAAGTASRMIGLLATGTGKAALAAAALAAALGILHEKSNLEYEGNFGNLELELQTLKANVDGLVTEAEMQISQIEEYSSRIAEAAEAYQTAASAFATDLSTFVLTGKELTEEEKTSLISYGQSITDAVLEGVGLRSNSSLTFLNSIAPENMSEEEYTTYSTMFDSLLGYFSELEDEAKGIGQKLQDAILDGLNDDGRLDQEERSIIQSYTDMLARIEAEIAAQTAQADYYAELEKAGRIDAESMEEYMEYLAGNHKERVENMNGLYDKEIGTARAAYENELGREVSDAEWRATDQYNFYEEKRKEGVSQIDAQTAELSRTAFRALMQDGNTYDSWNFAQRVMSEAPRDEKGNVEYENIDWAGYAQQGAIPDTFYEDLGMLQKKQGPLSFLGIGKSRNGSMLEEWKDIPGVSELYNMFSGEKALGEMQVSIADFQGNLGGWTHTGKIGDYYDKETGEIQSLSGSYDITTNVDRTQLDETVETAEKGTELDVNTVVDQTSIESTIPTDPIPIPIQPYTGETDRMTALQEQGVQVQVDGDTQQLQASIDGADGQNLMAHVDGDTTDLSMKIWDENGKLLVENVTGNATSLAAVINSFNGRTITVNVAGRKMFASGGRATSASIFGEAGPEWAIPEEHSERTANLLNAARAASGFTWPELLERYGGLNAGTNAGGNTIVYSPTINAQDASGVDSVLKEDKRRLERWMEEKRMLDEMEVYQ